MLFAAASVLTLR